VTVDLGGVQPLARALDASGKPGQRHRDALAELGVHGGFLAAPVGRAAQDRRLSRVGPGRQLDLDAVADRTPAVRRGELGGELA